MVAGWVLTAGLDGKGCWAWKTNPVPKGGAGKSTPIYLRVGVLHVPEGGILDGKFVYHKYHVSNGVSLQVT